MTCGDETYIKKRGDLPPILNPGRWIGKAGKVHRILSHYMLLVGEDLAETFPGTDQYALA